MLVQPTVSGGQGASADFATLLGGGFGGGGSYDFSNLGTGISQVQQVATAAGADTGVLNYLGVAANAAASGNVFGAAAAGASAIAALFAGKKTDEAKQSADVNKAAALVGISPAEAAAAIANHANNSSDHFDDLAANVATWRERMLQLIEEYNGSHSPKIVPGSVQAAEREAAQQQQALIDTAKSTPGFGNTTTGQQMMLGLQSIPASQAVGTQGETAGDVLAAIVKGIFNGGVKGGSDAAAETQMGKEFKKNYLKDWLKDNQLLAGGIVLVLGITAFKAYGPSHRKISF